MKNQKDLIGAKGYSLLGEVITFIEKTKIEEIEAEVMWSHISTETGKIFPNFNQI